MSKGKTYNFSNKMKKILGFTSKLMYGLVTLNTDFFIWPVQHYFSGLPKRTDHSETDVLFAPTLLSVNHLNPFMPNGISRHLSF